MQPLSLPEWKEGPKTKGGAESVTQLGGWEE